MKKLQICLLLGLILIASAIAIEYNYTTVIDTSRYFYPTLIVQSYKYEPYPVQPGTYFDIWIKIANAGEQEIEKLDIAFDDSYPFFLAKDEQRIKTFYHVSGFQSLVAKYKVRVAADAVETTSNVKIKVRMNKGNWVTYEFKIEIRPVNPVFLIQTTSQPEIISPGKQSNLTIKIKNIMNSVMKDVSLKLDLTNTPLVTIGSTTEKRVSVILPNQEAELTFKILAEPDAESGVYKIPISLVYYDNTGNEFTKEDSFGVLVSATPEFLVTLESSEIYKQGQTGKVVVSISNVAEAEAKFLSVTLMESKYYKIISSNRVYIGNLDPDDLETAEFNVHVNYAKNGVVPLEFLLEYKDSFNNPHKDVVIVEIPVYSWWKARLYGLAKSKFRILPIIITIIILIFLYKLYKNYRKEKDLEKALKLTIVNTWVYSRMLAKKLKKKFSR